MWATSLGGAIPPSGMSWVSASRPRARIVGSAISGLHPAGRDRIGQHALPPEPTGDALGERYDAGFRRGVLHVVRLVPAMSGAAGDVDDRSAAAPSVVQESFPAQVGEGDEVHLERRQPHRGPGGDRFLDAGGWRHRRVIDQDVDAAAPPHRVSPERPRCPGLGEVGPDQVAGTGGQRGGRRLSRLSTLSVVEHDRGAGGAQRPHDGGADAPGPAGDHDDLTRQVNHRGGVGRG